jgi:hypothetical protein
MSGRWSWDVDGDGDGENVGLVFIRVDRIHSPE